MLFNTTIRICHKRKTDLNFEIQINDKGWGLQKTEINKNAHNKKVFDLNFNIIDFLHFHIYSVM